jgi:hypothetical protein
VAYEGATVLEARVGYYTEPISVCDFASLYPSIMRAHNMCYCTRIPRNVAVDLPPEDVTVAPTGERFVKAHVRPGLLPEILTFLTDARKKAKADMKHAKDALEKAVLDGRQNALKVRGVPPLEPLQAVSIAQPFFAQSRGSRGGTPLRCPPTPSTASPARSLGHCHAWRLGAASPRLDEP